jgi:hypothetical protein
MYVVEHVKPVRSNNRRTPKAGKVVATWQSTARDACRAEVACRATSRRPKRCQASDFSVKLPITVAPEHSFIVIATTDDATFGILHSRIPLTFVVAAAWQRSSGRSTHAITHHYLRDLSASRLA